MASKQAKKAAKETRIAKRGHASFVYSVNFSNDGSKLVTTGGDKVVKVWDLGSEDKDPHVVRTLKGHTAWVYGASMSKDNKMICSCSEDKSIKIWSAETGKKTHDWGGGDDDDDEFEMNVAGVHCVAFSPDDQWVVSGSADKLLKLWRLADNECHQKLEDHSDWITQVAFSPDGVYLASSSYDKTAKVWRVSDGRCIQTMEGHQSWVSCVCWSPGGHTLITSSGDWTARLWNVLKGDELLCLDAHKEWCLWCAISPDGLVVATCSSDRKVMLWDSTHGTKLAELVKHKDWVECVAFDTAGERLASSSHDRDIIIWDVRDPREATPVHILQGFHRSWWGTIKGLFGAGDAVSKEEVDAAMMGMESLDLKKEAERSVLTQAQLKILWENFDELNPKDMQVVKAAFLSMATQNPQVSAMLRMPSHPDTLQSQDAGIQTIFQVLNGNGETFVHWEALLDHFVDPSSGAALRRLGGEKEEGGADARTLMTLPTAMAC